MPKVRRSKLPEAVFRHLLQRARERNITAAQFVQLSIWLNSNPDVPNGKWYKRFPEFMICGEGDLPKTFLLPGQLPDGKEVI
jgi:hypothetical protein